jgi:hypothetical protein
LLALSFDQKGVFLADYMIWIFDPGPYTIFLYEGTPILKLL